MNIVKEEPKPFLSSNVTFQKRYNDAIIPTRGSADAAGLDLYSWETVDIAPGKTIKIDTGISVELPKNTFGAIFARSGLATKQGLRPANCVGKQLYKLGGHYGNSIRFNWVKSK